MSGAIEFHPEKLLTFETATAEMTRFLKMLKAHPSAAFELDLSQVEHCDSAGLALLLEVKRVCTLKQVTLSFKHFPKAVTSLATFVGVKEILLGDENQNG